MMQYMVTLCPSPNCELFDSYSNLGKWFLLCKKIIPEFNIFSHEISIEPTRKKQPHIHCIFQTDTPIQLLKQWLLDTFYYQLYDPFQKKGDTWESYTDKKYPNATQHCHGISVKLTENFSNERDYLEKEDPDKGYQGSIFILINLLKTIKKGKTVNYYSKRFPDMEKPEYYKLIEKEPFELYQILLSYMRQTFISLSSNPIQLLRDKLLKNADKTQKRTSEYIDKTEYQLKLDKLQTKYTLATVASSPRGYKA